MRVCTWDLETTTKTSYKRKANPFDPANHIVMHGELHSSGLKQSVYYGEDYEAAKEFDAFAPMLAVTDMLVGHNIKFDVLHAVAGSPDNLEAWMEYISRGGQIWDTQLAEYLLEGMTQANHMLALDEVAPRYGGNTKFDEVKALWNDGVDTPDIPQDLLHRYLMGTDEEHGDLGNTQAVFEGQLQRARDSGQLRSILLNMGSLVCTIEMERNGMYVDSREGYKQAEELAEELSAAKAELDGYLPDLPFDFNWGSPKQKSAFIFGGSVPYEERVPILDDNGQQAYAQMQVTEPVLDDNGVPVTYKSGKNAGETKTRKVKANDPSKPKSRMETFQYVFEGVTKPKKHWAGAVPGVYSTSASVIEELGNRDIPFLQVLAKVTGMAKDLGTYYITTNDKGESSGMLTLVDEHGFIHHSLNHTSTVTGRFSSSNPNLQNIPKGGKSKVKSLFKSRFKGGKITQSDFSSLEVYVQAILTGAQQLIADLEEGLDMHCVRVSQKEAVSYENALLWCKDESHEKYPEWSGKRTKAKVFSFQRAYGAGAAKISESAKIPLGEVEALIKAEEARYPEVGGFYSDLHEDIVANAKPFGQHPIRHPDDSSVFCYLQESRWQAPDGKIYAWRSGPSPEFMLKRGVSVSFSPTEEKNYPVQGTGGEWAKAAMWLAVRAFYKVRNFGGQALLVNQVHDALYVDSEEAKTTEASALLHACMEEASTFMEYWFDWDIPVRVPSDTTVGDSMMDEIGASGTVYDKAKEYTHILRLDYMGGYEPSI